MMNVDATRFTKRSNIRSFTEARETPVILVCIYNKNGTIITHDLLYTLFSQYGKILRVRYLLLYTSVNPFPGVFRLIRY